jgi:hypothetical protein
VKVYFCDPQSPWQRGSNENTNGLLRQYFPKGAAFANVTQAQLNAVARELNSRPRKTLGYKTPAYLRRPRCTDRLNPPCHFSLSLDRCRRSGIEAEMNNPNENIENTMPGTSKNVPPAPIMITVMLASLKWYDLQMRYTDPTVIHIQLRNR